MIYIDSSVALSEVFSENRRPPRAFWDQPLVASRLTDLEMRVRATRTGRAAEFQAVTDLLAARINFLDIAPPSLELIYRGGTRELRTLDAIHLATVAHLNRAHRRIPLATYDQRLAAAADSLGIAVIAP